MRTKLYDEINKLNPSDLIQGDNGQDEYGRVQEVQQILMHRRMPPLKFSSVHLPESERVVYPVEMLVIDQYENVYYILSAVLADGEVYSFTERIRTNPNKKNYELQTGWSDVVWRRLRMAAEEAISDTQHQILKR